MLASLTQNPSVTSSNIIMSSITSITCKSYTIVKQMQTIEIFTKSYNGGLCIRTYHIYDNEIIIFILNDVLKLVTDVTLDHVNITSVTFL